ncbi:MAG: guanylate kinase, partial [Alphaproteobacteria bacterium]|nr:guanylate kinase [Alphaproteobacteria bacterium]
MSKRGTLFVISGPSAVGKSTVVERVLQIDPTLTRIITCTTRPMRSGEQDRRDYIFLDKEDFLARANRNEFVEFSEVYGNYYGVLLSTIRQAIADGRRALLVINWEGFFKVRQAL